jgi:SAM-dependent methyltransferase
MPRCPACHGSEALVVWQVDSAAAAQHLILREASPDRHEALRQHIEFLWQCDTCQVLRCKACGMGFAWPYVAGDAKFYELAYARPSYPTDRWEFRRTIKALQALQTRDCRALEVGSGFGAFLDAAVKRHLFEPSAMVAAEYSSAARQALMKKGYRTISADIRSADFDSYAGCFDFVFMFQVLEHMDGIDDVFARLRQLTSSSGRIFIAVPNPGRIEFNEQHGALMDMPPTHIGRWTPEAFEVNARRHGLSIADMDREVSSLPHVMLHDLFGRYLRKAQRPGTLPNIVRSWKRSRARRIAECVAIATVLPTMFAQWTDTVRRHSDIGESLWVHIHKPHSRIFPSQMQGSSGRIAMGLASAG